MSLFGLPKKDQVAGGTGEPAVPPGQARPALSRSPQAVPGSGGGVPPQAPSSPAVATPPVASPPQPQGPVTGAMMRNPSGVAPRPLPIGLTRATDIRSLLAEAVRLGASDLHLTRNMPPIVRVDGYLQPMESAVLDSEGVSKLVLSFLSAEQRSRFEQEWELDLSVEFPEAGRFRVNIHRQRGTVEAAFRVVNDVILPLRKLGLPAVVDELARRNMGLVIVTGPTGSGKTTTLASMVDLINHERQCMIVTVEDPIEYVHKNIRAVVKQRELTSDTHSFTFALRHVLRQDPDVIVIGEMRDLETITTALMAAETGHLVFSTLHTPDAVQTIDRMIDVFPPHQQDQTRIQMANTLQGVVAQQLIPVPGNRGRVVAYEVLVATMAVRKIIRSAKTEQLVTVLQTGGELGMVTMDKSLRGLYLQGLITYEDAISRCKNPEAFDTI